MSRSRTPAQRQRVRRGAAPGPADRRPSGRQLAIAGAIAVAAVAAFIAISSGTSVPPVSTVPPAVRQTSHVRGAATAPVTIEEWADFQCPACGQFARTTEQQLLSTYIANGQVKLVFRHFAFLRAGVAGSSAGGGVRGRAGEVLGIPRPPVRRAGRGESRGVLERESETHGRCPWAAPRSPRASTRDVTPTACRLTAARARPKA